MPDFLWKFVFLVIGFIKSSHQITYGLELATSKTHHFSYCASGPQYKIGISLQKLVADEGVEFSISACDEAIEESYLQPCSLSYSGVEKVDRTCLLSPLTNQRKTAIYHGNCSRDDLLVFINRMTHGFYSFNESDKEIRLKKVIRQSIANPFLVSRPNEKCAKVNLKNLTRERFLHDFLLPQRPVIIKDFLELQSPTIQLFSSYLDSRCFLLI